MEERLKNIFANINDWLKFAEAKNAAIIAFNGATLFGILQIIANKKLTDLLIVHYFLWAFIILEILGILIALFSFLPELKIPLLGSKKRKLDPKKDNLLFFGHIVKFKPEEYLRALYASIGLEKKEGFEKLELHFANQIIVNSKISLRKYHFFRIALWLTIAGILSIIIGSTIYIFKIFSSF